ncbi:MAG: tetratricopeptide repeat protein [Chloroflexi bacterium]|nr:tetratricopeptide repeat protein [Chloroflexota bacterium]
MGDYERALDNLHTAEKICIEINNRARLARVLEIVGFVHFSRKELELALKAMKRSVELSRDASIPVNLASSLNNISLIHLQLGQVSLALEVLNEAIELISIESQTFLARFLGNRAEIYCYLGEFSRAHIDFDEAVHLFESIHDQKGLLEVYLVKGYDFFAAQKDWKSAYRMYLLAEQILDEYPNQFLRSMGVGI